MYETCFKEVLTTIFRCLILFFLLVFVVRQFTKCVCVCVVSCICDVTIVMLTQCAHIVLARRCRTIQCARWYLSQIKRLKRTLSQMVIYTFCAIWKCESLLTMCNLNIIVVTNWDGKLLSLLISEVTSIRKAMKPQSLLYHNNTFIH